MEDLARQADALWRATVFVAVAQLHLVDNPLLVRPLTRSDVKTHPSGHWGTVPGAAWVLAHIALAAGTGERELVPVIGPGHAGVVQLALAWLTGELGTVRPRFSTDVIGLTRLVRSFPHVDGLGAEVSPLLSAGGYLGGCLGGALAFAQGAALDTPGRVVVPIIGDGECETPATSASWLAARELPNGAVLPIVQLNGFRMGAASVLGRMTDEEITAYAAGLGCKPRVFRLSRGDLGEHARFHRLLIDALHDTSQEEPTAIFLRCEKGFSGPAAMDGRPLLGTARLHKTPLSAPASDPAQLRQLRRWLASYRPHELFDHDGRSAGLLGTALRTARFHQWEPDPHPPLPPPVPGHGWLPTFAGAVREVVRVHAEPGGFRLFSPDELASNRLGDVAGKDWVTELLAEEVLLGWLAGWTASGRRGLLISYEAFATLLTTGLVAHLKQRRLTAKGWPSLNLLLTSYGWHNVYTHGDPSLVTALLGTGDPALRVLTPADPARIAATLDDALRSNGRVNVVIAGKHPTITHPSDTITNELSRGLAIWPHLSDDGEPDLTVVCAGDLAAAVTHAAVPEIRDQCGRRVRVVNIHDLTVLGDPVTWPAGLGQAEIARYLGAHAAVLVVTLGHPAAVWGLLGGRCRRPVEVIGWREPHRPMPQAELAASAGMDTDGLHRAALRLLTRREVRL